VAKSESVVFEKEIKTRCFGYATFGDTDAVNSMLAFFERKRWKILWTHGTGESFTNWT